MSASSRLAPAVAEADCVAVVDIGSNSIRLVVYDGLTRAPVPVFNEKVMCGLGRGLESSGRLDEKGVEAALVNLSRFAALAHAVRVSRLEVVATAAVRDATDGASFVNEVERRCGLNVRVLSGAEEARLSALGVLSGMPLAEGLMGDLGGGSLELVELVNGRPGPHATLPLGPLRLRDAARGRKRKARAIAEATVGGVPWLPAARGRALYLVGGAWRALARIGMAQSSYPLPVIHHYTLARADAESLATVVAGLDRGALEKMPEVPRLRLDSLPLAGLVLDRVLAATRPERVVFSAYGLREGLLFDALPPAARRQDPLIAACAELAARLGRRPDYGDGLHSWMTPIFPGEGDEAERLRRAACLIGDVAWREHPDYRSEQAFFQILRLPFVGIDHPGRAFVALAVAARYDAGLEAPFLARAKALLEGDRLRKARLVGRALRLGDAVSAGEPEVLRQSRLVLREDGRLRLHLAGGAEAFMGETVERRLRALAEAMGCTGAVALESAG